MNSMIATLKLSIILFLIFLVPWSSFSEPEWDKYTILEEVGAEFKKADDELNLVWGRIITKIKGSRLPEREKYEWLKQEKVAQRAWLKFRDESLKNFEYYYFRGGSGQSAGMVSFESRITRERTSQLRKLHHIKD